MTGTTSRIIHSGRFEYWIGEKSHEILEDLFESWKYLLKFRVIIFIYIIFKIKIVSFVMFPDFTN